MALAIELRDSFTRPEALDASGEKKVQLSHHRAFANFKLERYPVFFFNFLKWISIIILLLENGIRFVDWFDSVPYQLWFNCHYKPETSQIKYMHKNEDRVEIMRMQIWMSIDRLVFKKKLTRGTYCFTEHNLRRLLPGTVSPALSWPLLFDWLGNWIIVKVMLARLSFVTTATLEDPSHVLRLFWVERKIPLSLGHLLQIMTLIPLRKQREHQWGIPTTRRSYTTP